MIKTSLFDTLVYSLSRSLIFFSHVLLILRQGENSQPDTFKVSTNH